MKQIDARGLSCPMPMMLVQKEIKNTNASELEVLVDDKCAVENVTRLGNSQGYEVECEAVEDEFILRLKK